MENETIAQATTRRIGGSLVVTIPVEIVKEENIQENEVIDFVVKKRHKSYFGVLKGIGAYNREEVRMKDRF